MPPKAVTKSAPLPPKEAALFKTLLSQYEARQLKKAIKTADQILKKVGNHGETISMKGLVLTYQGKREEGMELVKKGVLLDLQSHICWHVHGLVHKQDKNYEEALKCYAQALKYDPGNMNILRDTATLQSQLRRFDHLEQTRLTILKLRPSLKQNWVALSVAYGLNNDWVAAQKLLEEFLSMVKEVPPFDPEFSELLLFYLTVLERNGNYEKALKQLEEYTEANKVVDRMHAATFQPRLLQKLGRTEEANEKYKTLIARNPDCYDFYRAYFGHNGLSLDDSSPESINTLTSELELFANQFPHALVPRRLPLTITSGELFQTLVKQYILRGLKKNIPSLFADLKPLYGDDTKRSVIQSIVEQYRDELEAESGTKDEDDSPTTYVWTLYFLGLHYSAQGEYQRAHDILNKAIEHTPTLPELYTAKARNLKRAGDHVGAAAALDVAAELDGQDRFLNTKCATYHLRMGDVEGAQKFLGMFTKKDALSPAKDLEDMQSFKFLLEDGEARMRENMLPMALKRFRTIDKIFLDFNDEQFDFHGFCIRRFTLNIYFDVVKWANDLRWHSIYIRAILNATKIYLRLFDTPGLAAEQTAPVPEPEGEKKSKKQMKRDKVKAAEEARKAAEKEKDEDAVVVKDDDPDGHKAISVEDPLEQAAKLLQTFTSEDHQVFDIWIATYDVAIRRKKYLQSLRALAKAKHLRPSSPEVHLRLIDFQLQVSSLDKESESMESILVKEGLSRLAPGEQSLVVQNSQYLQNNSTNAPAIVSVARASHKIGVSISEVEDVAFSLLRDDVDLKYQVGVDALQLLEEINSTRVTEFRDGCQKRLPLSTAFLSKDELAKLKQKAAPQDPDASEETAANGDLVIEPTDTTPNP
ncbi:hypothetical protein FRB91_000771 [Serendipita sp. 411]|nr:hypothetical protein FRB91_000771 [Serendipita sp. 411]